MGTVSAADCYFISRLDTGTFQYNVKLGYLARYILILKRDSFVVCQCILIPVFNDALFNIINELMFLFHSIFAHLI